MAATHSAPTWGVSLDRRALLPEWPLGICARTTRSPSFPGPQEQLGWKVAELGRPVSQLDWRPLAVPLRPVPLWWGGVVVGQGTGPPTPAESSEQCWWSAGAAGGQAAAGPGRGACRPRC